MILQQEKTTGLTGNQLKLLAMAAMTCDHIGLSLLPQYVFLRIIGRLAFPIFAYMIAEGCRYTRSKARYLLSLAVVALVCQVVYFVAMRSLYMCVMVTFSLSVGLIWLLDIFLEKKKAFWGLLFLAGVAAVYFVSSVLPSLWIHTDFAIDYGFLGIMLPVLIYSGKTQPQRLLLAAVGLLLLALQYGGVQVLSLAALIPLAMYSGKRGKAKLKYLFYLYYPLHLAAIHLLSLIF